MTRTFITGSNSTVIDPMVHDLGDEMPPRRMFVIRVLMLIIGAVDTIERKGKVYREKDLRFSVLSDGEFNPLKMNKVNLCDPKYLFVTVKGLPEEQFNNILAARYGDDLNAAMKVAHRLADKKTAKRILETINTILDTPTTEPATRYEELFNQCVQEARLMRKYSNYIRREVLAILNRWLGLGIEMSKVVDGERAISHHICRHFAMDLNYIITWYLYTLYVEYYE